MSTIITRLFHDRGRAAAAVAELQRVGFGASTIRMISRESAGAASGDGAVSRLVDLLTAARVAPAAAAAYAGEAVRCDGTLVVVQAAFTRAVPAEMALDTYGAVKLDVPDRFHLSAEKYDPTPLSDLLGLPVLISGNSSTTLMSGKSNTKLMSGESNTALMNNPAPLSGALNLPVLKQGAASKDTSFGLPLLSNNPAPLSSLFGLPTLTRSKGK